MNKKAISLLCFFLVILGALRLMAPPILKDISFSQIYYDRHNTFLRMTLSGDEKYRLPIKLNELSDFYKECVLKQEDQYFYYHLGFNPISLIRALIFRESGGSTITMQLVRVQKGLRTKSITGKLNQILQAFWLELTHSKKEILEAYFTLAPFGKNIEGTKAASLIYFQKKTNELSNAESLTLALIPQKPNDRTSHSSLSNELRTARNRLSQKWLKQNVRGLDNLIYFHSSKDLPFKSPHLIDYLTPISHGPEVHLTIDYQIQSKIQKIISTYIQSHSHVDVTNASSLLVNWKTREVISYIGSNNYFDPSIAGQVNGIMAKRSPGSTLKPFVYALAMDQGLIHPHSLLKDVPRSFGLFDPENFDQQFQGPLSATQALISSRNIPAVTLASNLQNPSFYEWLKKTGFIFYKPAEYYGLGLALGGAEASPYYLVELYTMLANFGEYAPLKMQLNSLQNKERTDSTRYLSQEASFLTLDMLTQNIKPQLAINQNWLVSNVPVAWKTGTSFGFRDAWTIGVVGDYVLCLWIGNFNQKSNPAFIGRDLAAPLFFKIIEQFKDNSFSKPSWRDYAQLNLKKISTCSLSGHLPNEYCPHKQDTFFIANKSPISTCPIHRPVFDKDNHLINVEEVWDSEFTHLFHQAGIDRTQINSSRSYSLPEIVSPRNQIEYIEQISRKEKSEIVLKAIVDGSVKKIQWFINHALYKTVMPQETVSIEVKTGEYRITLVDDHGQVASRFLKVIPRK